MKTVELSLVGIKCMGCVNRIKNVLEKAIDAIENLGFKVLK